MRKKGMKIVVCATLMAMVLAFSACGSDKDSKDESTKTTEESDDKEEISNEKYKSVEAFVASDIVQSQLETLKTQIADAGMSLEITAEGNKLIYTYTYQEITMVDGMTEALESAMETQKSTFESAVKSLKAAVDADDLSVEVRYIDANGTTIYAREFKAE